MPLNDTSSKSLPHSESSELPGESLNYSQIVSATSLQVISALKVMESLKLLTTVAPISYGNCIGQTFSVMFMPSLA